VPDSIGSYGKLFQIKRYHHTPWEKCDFASPISRN
jgi:hypothetical protein